MLQKKVDYYLRDDEGNKISLQINGDKFTILLKEEDPTKRKELALNLKKIVGGADLEKLSEKIYRVNYSDPNSYAEIDRAMERIRKEMPHALPYYTYNAQGNDLGVYYVTDRIIVTLNSAISRTKIELLAKKYQLKTTRKFDPKDDIVVFEMLPGNSANVIEIANRIEDEEKDVEIAEPSMVNMFTKTIPPPGEETVRLPRPTDGLFESQWNLNSVAGDGILGDAGVNASDAWNALGNGGDPAMVIAVIDFGFDINHPDLVNKRSNVNLTEFDFVTPEFPFPTPNINFFDHGTQCAGIAIAERNGTGVVGVAYGCSFVPVRIPPSPTDDQLLDSFKAIRHEADVVSCSFAPGIDNHHLNRSLSRLLTKIAKDEGRRGKGCVICFSAGNNNLPLNLQVVNFQYSLRGVPQDLYTGLIKNRFASHPAVIAVAASTSGNNKAKYSDWGKEVCVCAPSSDFIFEPTDIIGPGIATTSTLGELQGGRYTKKFGGTSAATPLVAGIAALVLSANPSLKAKDVKSILQGTADKINLGSPQLAGTQGEYDNREHSDWFGFGKVNAAKAVVRAIATLS